ncbi:MAG: 50S ribosomal protein P1 [Candidatus Heimdallarchaeum aukensis]|uniref:Large ribosomal subunit protein P1 n=2 Tax=Candidatus Heimdallarchaeum TaxID=3053649 RepID=A0A9Y1FME8_9ARCH|nr:MAG: 50S ribosomal protein P1 [Candidatus Heimdallarchaeum aukensis]UJG42627.1 MAG: 50S ribosomal protein P1 [Candidatus Heimdallarchaeum endolithica]
MEYVYAAMILHELGKEINEQAVKKVLEAAGASVDESRVKALVAALEEVDIEQALETAVMAAAAPSAPASAGGAEEKAEEKKEEPEEEEEEEDLGLGALFG